MNKSYSHENFWFKCSYDKDFENWTKYIQSCQENIGNKEMLESINRSYKDINKSRDKLVRKFTSKDP